jgi:hypothetical protein
MIKSILGTAAIALSLGLAAASLPALAGPDQTPSFAAMADSNKDGMVSRQEFLNAMGKMYDERMAKMKAMPAADRATMIKQNQMTSEAYRMFLHDILGGN